jgi:hypothetical protein
MTPSGTGYPSPFQLLAQLVHKLVDTVIAVAGLLLWLVMAVFMLLVEFVLYVFAVMTIPLAPFFPLVLPLATGLMVCWFVVGTESLFAALGLPLQPG